MKKEEIIDTETEKKKSNILINLFILLIIFIVSVFMYSKYIGTKGINIHEYRIESEQITQNFSGLKIIYLSDLLYGSTDLDDLNLIVKKINELKPDLILYGGDLISKDTKISKKEKQKIIDSLNELDSSLGKYATTGSLDDELYKEIMNQSNFQILNNDLELIYKESLTPICLIGVGSYILGDYNLEKSFEKLNINCFTILFTHETDIIDKILEQEKKPNIILAGSSLGGEINIPFYGPLAKFEGSTKYYKDYYEKDGVKIYISSGIGTKKYNVRLFNKPSFNLFRLKSTHKS